MKNKNKTDLDALRFLKSRLMENKTAVKPIGEMDIIISHVKKLKDSISLYPEGSETVTQLEAEIKVVEQFLPKQLSEVEVVELIKAALQDQPGIQFGPLMKELSQKTRGQYDGKKLAGLVKTHLG